MKPGTNTKNDKPSPTQDGVGSILQRLVRLIFGQKWICTHTEKGATVIFRAKTKHKAKKKLRQFIQEQMYGRWAMTYNPSAVEEHVNKCTIEPNDQVHPTAQTETLTNE